MPTSVRSPNSIGLGSWSNVGHEVAIGLEVEVHIFSSERTIERRACRMGYEVLIDGVTNSILISDPKPWHRRYRVLPKLCPYGWAQTRQAKMMPSWAMWSKWDVEAFCLLVWNVRGRASRWGKKSQLYTIFEQLRRARLSDPSTNGCVEITVRRCVSLCVILDVWLGPASHSMLGRLFEQ